MRAGMWWCARGGREAGTGRLELVSLRASLQAPAWWLRGAHPECFAHQIAEAFWVCVVGSLSSVLGLQLSAAGAVCSSCCAGHVAVRSAGLAAPHGRCWFSSNGVLCTTIACCGAIAHVGIFLCASAVCAVRAGFPGRRSVWAAVRLCRSSAS